VGRIEERFSKLRAEGKKGLVVYLMGGDSDIGVTEQMIPFLAGLGVDVIEIGVPFSDPLADGPTIQAAGQRALGTTLADLLKLVGKLREKVEIPLLFMSYTNPILHFGVERFIEKAAKAGLDGLIVPDLTPEEGQELISRAKDAGLDYIQLLAPTTSDARMKKLVCTGSGFLYYVSRTGTTGEKSDLAADLGANLERIRGQSDMPIAVGFGISNPDNAAQAAENADGVVIGSAIVKRMADSGGDLKTMQEKISGFLCPIIARLHGEKGEE
jgi:tryptophan synthase alpha chain